MALTESSIRSIATGTGARLNLVDPARPVYSDDELAEISAEHTGKTLRLELYDPGEGGQNIQIMRPLTATTWTPATFTYKVSTAATMSSPTTSVDVTASRYNGKVLQIDVPLGGYSPPSNNNWWQIRYTFSGQVNDRTTWSAEILGDPIHLVEEW